MLYITGQLCAVSVLQQITGQLCARLSSCRSPVVLLSFSCRPSEIRTAANWSTTGCKVRPENVTFWLILIFLYLEIKKIMPFCRSDLKNIFKIHDFSKWKKLNKVGRSPKKLIKRKSRSKNKSRSDECRNNQAFEATLKKYLKKF